MRTIKFRGKVLHRKSHQKNEWVYGMPTIFRDGRTALRWQCSEKAKDPEAWKTQSVEPETLGQFTGVYDRNGKEIYEGDVVVDDLRNEYEVCWYDDLACFMAEMICNERPFLLYDIEPNKCEIIGNIHEQKTPY